jgi:glyoxylase-like metal-dependent hydrolase (beta-lactamase superfamily II)
VTTLRIDDATKRLAGVAGLGTHPLLGDLVPTWRFADYRTVDGLLVPHAFEHATNGLLQLRSRLTHVAVNAALLDTLFQPPVGYARRAPAGPPALGDAGVGVHVVERLGDARATFVDTDEGLVAFEAPGSPALVEQALALLERALPGKRVRYVVLTHHHAENLGGLGAYVARGATLLVPPGMDDHLRRLLAAPRAFGAWTRPAAGPAPAPTIEVVRGRRRIGRGDRRVEVVDAGPTSHATGMLVAWLPAPRLLLQSDLLRVNEPGGPALGTQAAADLAAIVRRHRLDVARILGPRGREATIDDLRAAAGGR